METQSLPVHETNQAEISYRQATQVQDTANDTAVETGTVWWEADGDGNDSGSDLEERYGLLRNAAAMFLWYSYDTDMKGENEKDSDVEDEVLESKVLYVARLNGWIMNVSKCLVCEEERGGQRDKD